jgi:cell division septal protein FtsQ
MNTRRVKIGQRSTGYGRPTYGLGRPTGRVRIGWWARLGPTPRRLVALVVIMGVLVWVLGQMFAITNIAVRVVDDPAGSQQRIRALVREHLATQTWQGNLITFSPQRLETSVMAADSLVKTIATTRRLPHSLSMVVTLKQPSLGWTSGNATYVLDKDGSIIGPLVGKPDIPVVVDGSNVPVQVGQRVTTARFVNFTTSIAEGLSAAKLSATRYEVRDTTLDLYVTTNKEYQLIFDTGRDAAGQIGDLKTLLGFLASQKKTPTAYIDLRIAGKAYYK